MEIFFKYLQKGHAKLRKASEETNRRLNQVLEEQHHCKRDMECLDQDLNKLLNVYQNMKPQPPGHALDNPNQEKLKQDVLLDNNPRCPSKYQFGEKMTYSEKEALKQLQEASSWPKLSYAGEYDDMELFEYIDGLFINV
ncbi:hypothetical protein O181_083302 [Austropuccinia psidii MF-1]|uniref:Uncharacterized protein n=1 Tax=Austropuccinia psidii MF-1 TaxID=1389203 RepID=A0A9Q3FU60_9BASI|nr:hypothetical protein [Austropuccinia psidii MF-1]